MRRHLATLAAASALMLAFAFSASPALAGSPAFHTTVDATLQDPVVCSGSTYTVVSGTFVLTYHVGSSASGNTNAIDIFTARSIVVEDLDGNVYPAVGAEHFGATSNARTGGYQEILVFKFQIVGTSDSLNLVMRWSPSGEFSGFGPGTCSAG
jgi:hypothetical protein